MFTVPDIRYQGSHQCSMRGMMIDKCFSLSEISPPSEGKSEDVETYIFRIQYYSAVLLRYRGSC